MIFSTLSNGIVSLLNTTNNLIKTVEIGSEVAVQVAESWQSDLAFERQELAADRKAALQARINAQKALLNKTVKAKP